MKGFVSDDVSDGLLRRHENLVVVHFFTSGDLAVDLCLKSLRGSRDRSVLGDRLNKCYGGLNEIVRLQLRNFVL